MTHENTVSFTLAMIDAKSAFTQLSPEHQKIIAGLAPLVIALTMDQNEEALVNFETDHPEAADALRALKEIPAIYE